MNRLSCPLCSTPLSTSPFKSWAFGSYKVTRYECLSCRSKFNRYDGPKGSFTIPKAK